MNQDYNNLSVLANETLSKFKIFTEEYIENANKLLQMQEDGEENYKTKKYGEEFFIEAILFYNNQLSTWRNEFNKPTIIELMHQNNELMIRRDEIEEIILETIDNVLIKYTSFIRSYSRTKLVVVRKNLLPKLDLMQSEYIKQIESLTDWTDRRTLLMNQITKEITANTKLNPKEHIENRLKSQNTEMKHLISKMTTLYNDYKRELSNAISTNNLTELEKMNYLKVQNIMSDNIAEAYISLYRF